MMGARHSRRREWSFDSSGAAGDGSSTTGKSFHRSLTSSGKRRIRWSKLTRSHSDRTPAKLSTNPLNYGETSGTGYLQDYSPTNGCSAVSIACQTDVHTVSVKTQTECDDLQGWKMIDDDHCFLESNFPSNQHDIVNGSNVDSSQKSHCRMNTDCKLFDVRKNSVKHMRLDEAKSRSFEKDSYSSVLYNGNHMQKCKCCTDVTVNPHSCRGNRLSSESDRAFGALENFKLEKKVVQSSCICSTQLQREKHLSVDADIKLLDKRKQSYSSESRSVTDCGSVPMLQLNPTVENTVDLGSSFGSLNSEDMMLDTEVDDSAWPSNVRSHHASADVGSSAHYCRSNCCLSSKCHNYFGHQIKYQGNEIPQRSDSVGRKCFTHSQNASVDSPHRSELVMIPDNIKHTVNGWTGPDPVLELTPTTISNRYFNFMFDTCIITSMGVFQLL